MISGSYGKGDSMTADTGWGISAVLEEFLSARGVIGFRGGVFPGMTAITIWRNGQSELSTGTVWPLGKGLETSLQSCCQNPGERLHSREKRSKK